MYISCGWIMKMDGWMCYFHKKNSLRLDTHMQNGFLGFLDSTFQCDLGWRLWVNWILRNLFKGSLRFKRGLETITWAPALSPKKSCLMSITHKLPLCNKGNFWGPEVRFIFHRGSAVTSEPSSNRLLDTTLQDSHAGSWVLPPKKTRAVPILIEKVPNQHK